MTVSSIVMIHFMPWFDLGSRNNHWSTQLYERDGHYLHDRYQTLGRVSAHYTPMIGPYDSGDAAVADLQMELVKQTGAHGIMFNWYGITGRNDYAKLKASADVLVPAAVRAGLLWSLCYEDRTFIGSSLDQQTQLNDDWNYIKTAYIETHGGVLRDGADGTTGRPVFLNFGPIHITSPTPWASMLTTVFPSAAERPYLLGLDGPNGQGTTLPDGDFSWPGGSTLFNTNPTTESVLNSVFSGFYGAAKTNAYYPVVGTAYPRFHDYYTEGSLPSASPEAWWGINVLALEGRTLQVAFEQAEMSSGSRSKADVVQVATWNDWQEGTIIEPSAEEGFTHLLNLQQIITGSTNEAAMLAAVQGFNALKANVWHYCDNVPIADRVDCGHSDETSCEAANCCWRPVATSGRPHCFSKPDEPVCSCRNDLRNCTAVPGDRLCCCTHTTGVASPPPPVDTFQRPEWPLFVAPLLGALIALAAVGFCIGGVVLLAPGRAQVDPGGAKLLP